MELYDAVIYGFPYKLRPKPKIASLDFRVWAQFIRKSVASFPGSPGTRICIARRAGDTYSRSRGAWERGYGFPYKLRPNPKIQAHCAIHIRVPGEPGNEATKQLDWFPSHTLAWNQTAQRQCGRRRAPSRM